MQHSVIQRTGQWANSLRPMAGRIRVPRRKLFRQERIVSMRGTLYPLQRMGSEFNQLAPPLHGGVYARGYSPAHGAVPRAPPAPQTRSSRPKAATRFTKCQL